MSTINNISHAVIALIRAGVVFRLVYCAIRRQSSEDESYKQRMIHAVIFYILAESAFQIKEIALYYYQ